MNEFEEQVYGAIARYEKKQRGGKRTGSGRKIGINDGRKQITVRIDEFVLEKLKPKPALRIREIIEASLL
jgi:hypothetical protein